MLMALLLVTGIANAGNAQNTRYLIRFKNKSTNPFSITAPDQFLSQRSIARRTRYNIAIDSTDLPVTPRFIDSVRLAGAVTILNVSKWLNQISIQTTDAAALASINSFSFVQSVQEIASAARNESEGITAKTTNNPSSNKTNNTTADFYNYGKSYSQVHIHNGEFLHNIGLRGQGMIIGMLDAGYYNYTGLRSFDSVRLNNQILGTWDFVARNASVTEDAAHGMSCFSIIAGNIPGEFVGTAPKANFYLYRTEDASTEYPIEEHNWVCGAERLDSAGGDLISSSLGYNRFDQSVFNHTYADMNGNTTMAAIGADLAAKKGILVVNAAGNEGASSWKYIMTPADGDSVMAVGAVDINGNVGGFSSYGPSSDGQVKPDVSSVGVATFLQNTGNGISQSNGTSFACPNMAGLTTCLWQGFQEFNNMKIINALRQAGSIYTTPNDRIGYGIPDVKKAVMSLLKDYATSTATIVNCKTTLTWNSKDVAGMKYEIERKAPGENDYTKIGEQAGSGSIFSNKTYQFADTLINMQSGAFSYRIKQYIDSAAATVKADYIDTVTVSLTSSCVPDVYNPAKPVQVNPNPARGAFVLHIANDEAMQNIKIVIINAAGQTVQVVNKSKQAGSANFTIPVPHLADGKYMVLVYNDNSLLTTEQVLIMH